jgi:hypothetical protein
VSGLFELPRQLQQAVQATRRDMEKLTAQITGANDEPVRKSASVLARSWRKVLSRKAGGIRISLKTRRARGEPSAPGQPPHEVSGLLRKSIRTGVVDGVRRVGTGSFTSRLLNFGVDSTAAPAKRILARKRGKARAVKVAKARRIRIAARPHAEPALQAVESQMTDVFVSEAQRRVAQVAL